MSSKAFPKPKRNPHFFHNNHGHIPLFPLCGKCRDRRSTVHLINRSFTGWWCLPCLEVVAPETAKLIARSTGGMFR